MVNRTGNGDVGEVSVMFWDDEKGVYDSARWKLVEALSCVLCGDFWENLAKKS